MAGCGFDSYAIFRTNLKLKKYFGGLAYFISGVISAFKYKPKKISLDIDHKRIIEFGYYVVVENTGSYGGKFKIVPQADYNDGLLDICVFKKCGYWDVFRYFFGVALGKHLNYPDVRYYQCKTLTMNSEENVLLHVDGELIGSLPVKITVKKEMLSILCPDKTKYTLPFFK
jgi:diacylglycerol kinase family enzyme